MDHSSRSDSYLNSKLSQSAFNYSTLYARTCLSSPGNSLRLNGIIHKITSSCWCPAVTITLYLLFLTPTPMFCFQFPFLSRTLFLFLSPESLFVFLFICFHRKEHRNCYRSNDCWQLFMKVNNNHFGERITFVGILLSLLLNSAELTAQDILVLLAVFWDNSNSFW